MMREPSPAETRTAVSGGGLATVGQLAQAEQQSFGGQGGQGGQGGRP